MLTILLTPHARLPTCSATYSSPYMLSTLLAYLHCTEDTFVDSSEENIYITAQDRRPEVKQQLQTIWQQADDEV